MPQIMSMSTLHRTCHISNCHCSAQVHVLPNSEYNIKVHVMYNIPGDGPPAAVVIHGYHLCTLRWFWSTSQHVCLHPQGQCVRSLHQ
jgi:hypothetical protein